MARFRGEVQGSRGPASRLGSKNGLVITANGWNAGVKVIAQVNEKTGRDEFYIYKTGGSHGHKPGKLLGVARE